MNDFAPVLIPTLNRHVHLKRCVESLAACAHADKTDLYIFLDYPLKDNHWEGYEHIKAYLPNIKGFKTVNIIERERNYGAVDNFFKSLEYVFKRYDRMIFSEDDNEFSPNFLDYMNKGLDGFREDPSIYAICGYNYPIEMPQDYPYNYYAGRAFSAWGCGMWKNRYEAFRRAWHHDAIIQLLRNTRIALKISRKINSLLEMVRKGDLYVDVSITAHLQLNNMNCVFPAITKVKNYGHDGSGIHCGNIKGHNLFISQKLDQADHFEFSKAPELIAARTMNKILQQYFRQPARYYVITMSKYILYRLTGKIFTSIELRKLFHIIYMGKQTRF